METPLKVMVILPTYNEVDNLTAMTSALFALLIEGLEVLVVDDASPDGTGQLADKLAASRPDCLHVIHRAGKLGLGTAYVEGFTWALQHGADRLIQMDTDFSHSPDYLPQMIEQTQEYDVVVGSRYVAGGKVDERWSWGRWFLSWWANSVWVRFILGVKTHDATAGFKCWRATALQKIGLDRVRSNGYVFMVDMCYLSEKLGLRIKEIPIYFEDRRIGKSKMSIKVKIEAALRVIEIRLRYRGLKTQQSG